MWLHLGKRLWRAQRRRLCTGVTLLAYLVAAIGFPMPEAAAQSPHACGQQVCCCGSAEQCKASGCGCAHEKPKEPEPVDCCAKKKPCCQEETDDPEEPTPSEPEQNPIRWVVGMSAAKCRGSASEWLGADAALPMAAPLSWQPSWPFCHSLPVTHEYPHVISAEHLDPPPRLEAV